MLAKVAKKDFVNYGHLNRGTSISIPVFVKNEFDEPYDLTGYKAVFTMKNKKYDFDRNDSEAFVQKIIKPQVADKGEFYIELSSYDLDIEPAEYCFDICLTDEKGAVARIVNGIVEIIGGPTNMLVTREFGKLTYGDGIFVYLRMGAPIVCMAPAIQIASPDEILYSKMADVLNSLDTYKAKVDELELIVEELQESVEALKSGGEG